MIQLLGEGKKMRHTHTKKKKKRLIISHRNLKVGSIYNGKGKIKYKLLLGIR